jgi:hypothetical protein
VGVVELAGRLPRLRTGTRRTVLGGIVALAAFGVLANVAVSTVNQAYENPGPVLADLVERQDRWSGLLGGDLDDLVEVSVELPVTGRTDEIHIVDECQAQYVGTGEQYTPWAEGGARPIDLRITRSADQAPGAIATLPLAVWAGHERTTLLLERDGSRYRLALDGGGRDRAGDWIEPAPGDEFSVEVSTDRVDDYVATLAGADGDVRVHKQDHDSGWHWQPNVLGPLDIAPPAAAAAGVIVEVRPTDPPPGCEDRLQRFRERVAADAP